MTRFGSVWSPVEVPSGLLRAFASRYGLALGPLPYRPVALGSVVAVDALMMLSSSTSLDALWGSSGASSAAFRSCLRASAGWGVDEVAVSEVPYSDVSALMVGSASFHARMLGSDTAGSDAALAAAVSLLCSCEPYQGSGRILDYAAVLTMAAS